MDKIFDGDVRNAEKIREPASVYAFSDARRAQEDPLHATILGILDGEIGRGPQAWAVKRGAVRGGLRGSD
ncbi:hypothetical protein ACFX2I_007356 [Malus domestica]